MTSSNKLKTNRKQEDKTDDNPPWTAKDFATAVPFREIVKMYLAEQAEQEPVAWLWCKDGKPQSALLHKPTTFPQDSYWQDKGFAAQPLYAAPVRTKDLTDEEIWATYDAYSSNLEFARAVIAKDREKNK